MHGYRIRFACARRACHDLASPGAVLEIAHNGLLAEERVGALMKVEPGEEPELVLDGLNFPTGLTIQGNTAYITDCGTCAGGGRVLRVPL